MLNKISTIAFIKTELEKKESPNGKTLHKFLVSSKHKDQYMSYQVTLWGNRFDGVLEHLQKDKAIYVEGDLQIPTAYLNKEGKPSVMLSLYATRIELLPRGEKKQACTATEDSTACKIQELPTEEPLPF